MWFGWFVGGFVTGLVMTAMVITAIYTRVREDKMKKKSNAPSRKWYVAQVAAIGAWVTAAIQAGWDIGAPLQIIAVGIVVQAFASWLIPNAEEGGE